MKRVRACMDRPSRAERRLINEIDALLALKIPIGLSRIAFCQPIAMLGSACDGAAFREVFEIVPFLQQIMSLHCRTNVALGMVLQFVSPVAIRHFSLTPTSPYWMNVIGAYEFPSTSALSLTRSFSPWDADGTTCVYAVADGVFTDTDGCVFVPAHMAPSNALPLYLVKFSIRE